MNGYTLHEAIVLARDIYKQVGTPPPFVKVDPILRYAERVEEQRSGVPHKIEVYTSKVTRSDFRGFWIRGKQISKIYVCNDLNYCWKRFVMCKEATHLLVDDDERLATTMQEQTEEAFELFWPKTSKGELTSEVFAAVVT
jgi:hypothetical protein